MKTFKSKEHALGGSFVFLLLGIFAVFAVLMVLLTAQLYRSSIDAGNRNNERRMAVNYLMNAVASGDQLDAIGITEVEGSPAIEIRWSDEEQDSYRKLIYCLNGRLYELLADCDEEPEAEFGEPVCAMQSMTPVLKDGLLTIGLENTAGEHESVAIRIYAGKGEADE